MGTTKHSFFYKFLFFINSVLAVLLLLSYVLPYVSPKIIPIFAVLSLSVPLLIISNIIFTIFWIVKIQKHFLLSGVVLLIGYFMSSPFYNFSNTKNVLENDLTIMSYNVRTFNNFGQLKEKNIGEKIINFVNKKQPDIVAFQEFHEAHINKFNFKYNYFVAKPKHTKYGLAIFSNYEIINKKSLEFQNSANNTIYIDILKNNDTIRIYNVHLQSLGINLHKENFGEKDSKSLLYHLENRFVKQAEQTELILKSEQEFKGKKIICGDFNNTAYSWVYRKLANKKNDAFLKAGEGFGKTFNYYFPMRIDFILIDEQLTINRFDNFALKYSDHEPILARIENY